VALVLIGSSHKTAPVTLREKLVVTGKEVFDTLRTLRETARARECALLVTCNRTEIYAVTDDGEWQERLVASLARRVGLTPGQLREHLYTFEGLPVARHLFRVASGLDSLVLGEAQILGQVKEALQLARGAETAGPLLNGLFQHALAAGKRARAETEIGRGAVSVSLAAVQLARQIFGELTHRVAMVLGAGKMSAQTVRFLLDEGVSPRVLVCNRTPGRAAALAEEFGGEAVPWERFPEALARADIVISSTSAPHPVVTPDHVRAALRHRRGRPLFLIDIAVPRDVDPAVGDLDDVYLFNIDDLQQVVDRTLSERRREAQRVEAIVAEEVARFEGWLRTRAVAPTIAALQQRAEQVVAEEIARVGGKLAHLDPRDREVVQTLARAIARKLIHPPIARLRAAAAHDGFQEIEAVRRAFDLDTPAGRDGADTDAEAAG